MDKLTLGSLFDGSGGFPLGGLISGITPVWASEIEPFPIRVTTKRLPFIKHYGDISYMDGSKIEPVDIITFGSPCQDLSIAGKRDGLDGKRSSLFYEAIRIIKEMRCATDGKKPRYIVWENVPGAFSSNKGEDFRCVLEGICHIKDETLSVPKIDKWKQAGTIVGDHFSLAWRVLDAQYWGVPQRRKRIFLVADFAGGGAGEILFKSEGLSGYSKKSIRSWQGTASNFADSTGETSTICLNDQGGERMDVTTDITCTLRAKSNHPPCIMDSAVFDNHGKDTRFTGPIDVAPTISATYGTGGNNQPFVVENSKTYDVRFTSEGTVNARSNVYESDTARTIDTSGNAPDSNQGGIAVVESYGLQGSMIGRADKNGPQGDGVNEELSFTLNTVDKHAVVYAIDRESFNCGQNYARNLGITEDGINSTLNAQGPSAVATPTYSSSKASFFTNANEELANTLVATDYKDPPLVNVNGCVDYTVRRLTPTECARLQGFPDWWCSDLGIENPTMKDLQIWYDIFETYRKATGSYSKPKTLKQITKWLKNPHSDSAEYKMWGNGVALPNVCFVLSGIVWYTQLEGNT
ncbi:DNA cytosine methyltransferase [Listeria monocytogenes]|uniref:DNA cytosine methyltransferase n=1 Tax=Listeria monocytogenes TaxID=1639 RepID=UPI00164F2C73|nr:DNA cytosine methyltransferase [Listeria monocytogenes]EIV7423954.1 DNA cytosine methyltransferase [Listeria monocytogenes]EIV7426181.1 DNA cytosine methyltransferase [Listeria monocytogenes]EKO7300040.1 DNA cytosine methyltransferase [Listeria monocytogenes]EKO7371354.1 DNA cytosine methyltransferase [Listeria monocytogenes]EKO7371732.1 DNA cytosine methyltransferase [Listeria monocytogenes]